MPVRCRPVCLLLPGCVVFSLPGVVAVAGSRVLPASGLALVAQVVPVLAAGGVSFAVGCCSGADTALLATVSPSRVRCFAAFGSGGVGSGQFSAVAAVSTFAGAGGSVQWWAGGSAFVPLRVRLARRTRAVVAAANVGLLVFFGSPNSRGSLLACQCAVLRGLPVVAFPCGFSGALLPSFGSGSWVAVGGVGVWSSAFLWVQTQQKCI